MIGYRVAGKTGTAWKSFDGGYSTDRYMAVFAGRGAGVASETRHGGGHRRAERRQVYYGGDVAAPVFSNVMSGALRLMDIPPDDLQNVPAATLVQANEPP